MNLETLIIATLFENGGGMTLKQIANKNELPKKYLDKLKKTAKQQEGDYLWRNYIS